MSLDVVRCPRCDQELAPFHGQDVAGVGVRADLCLRCRGVWLDGREVEEIAPAFEELATSITLVRPEELQAGAVIARCPRCRAATRPLRFFELLLDVCLECRGLWIDGEELLDLARTADRAEGLPAPLPRQGGNRSSAVRALRAAEATRDRQLDAPVDVHEPAGPAPHDLSGSGEFTRALRIYVDAAMAIGGTCPRCRCHAASRCSH